MGGCEAAATRTARPATERSRDIGGLEAIFEGGFREFNRGLKAKVEIYRDWKKLIAEWAHDAEVLGKAFAQGDARVDPKDAEKTCRRCELHTLCRVYEK